MPTNQRDFNKEAARWDANPHRVKMAKDIAASIRKQITLTPQMDILDFGCGTGVLALELQPFVRSVTAVDSSQGMLDIVEAKAAQLKLDNVKTRLVDMEQGDKLTGHYDLVVCSMTLHHIEEPGPVLQQFFSVTKAGGYLSIADLDPEGGQFHEDPTGVFHHGFDKAVLSEKFRKTGYANISVGHAADMVKPGKGGKVGQFTLFLMTGQRKS
jgi:2-polyprenyl-3-methyl-5-hydroxy-6-metoxy-1,4-benzoquinol methylase